MDGAARWLAALPALREEKDFSRHIQAYEEAFQKKATPPFEPLWYPELLGSHQPHLQVVLQELGHPSYESLHRWSVERRADFWRYLLQRLHIPFERPPVQILAFPEGDIAQPRWLTGAVWNSVEALFRADPQNVALVFYPIAGAPRTWTYEELLTEVRQVAGAFRARGLQPGQTVALCLPMRPEAIFLYLGALYAGITVATIPDSLSGEEIAARLEIVQPQLFFTQDGLVREGKFLPLYDRLQAYRLPRTYLLATGEALQARLRNNVYPYRAFFEDLEPLTQPHRAGSYHPIGVLFSSGTTATPKAIPWTHLTAFKALADGHLYHDLRPGDVVAWPTNLGWMMGPWLLFAGLGAGATVALYEGPPTTPGFCAFVEQAGVTVLGVVPSLVRRWVETQAWAGQDWSRIRLFSSTGEASNPWHMWQLMAKAGYKPILEYCGGTEIGGGYITSTLLHPNAPSQFSAPALGLDFVLLSEEGQPADEGELFLVPPSIGLSQTLLNADHEKVYYADTPPIQAGWQGATGAPIPQEYGGVPVRLRRHGDYMRRLPSGYWVSGGRADDAMNLGGIKVSSAEIERVVAQVAGVSEAAAIAVPPPEGGPDRLVLYLVLQEGQPRTPALWKEACAQAIREKLSPLFALHEVMLVEELPRTASNKVMRRLLRQRYLEQQAYS